MGIINKKTVVGKKNKLLYILVAFLMVGFASLVVLGSSSHTDAQGCGVADPFCQNQDDNNNNPPSGTGLQSVDVDASWSFYKQGSTTVAIDSGGRMAFFEWNGTDHKQRPDYYSQGKNNWDNRDCLAHIGIGQQNDGVIRATLYEPEKDDACNNDTYRENPIDIQTKYDDKKEGILKNAGLLNWGNPPLGCPGEFKDGKPPNNATYNCPDGENRIEDGELKEGTIAKADVTSATGEGEKSDGCESTPGFVLGWIICPIGEMLAGATQLIDAMIGDLLFIDTEVWEDSGIRTVWASFARIATTLIVLILLIAIASQIFNFEVFSAYTIKKVMPKIFIAVILIWLSWFIVTMAINMSNVVGFSVQSLFSTPINELTDASGVDKDTNGYIDFAEVTGAFADARNSGAGAEAGTFAAIGVGAGIVGGVSLSIAVAAGSWGFILMILLGAVITVLMAFVVILIRYVALMGLLIAAPLAIVAWILPSTNKWFDKWKEMFIGLLLMFPIIMAVLTLGKMGAVIMASGADEGYNFAANLALLSGAMILYFLPYFFLFKLLKLSGGALSKLQGALDGAGKTIREKGPMKALGEKVKADTEQTKEFKKDEAFKRLAKGESSRFRNVMDKTATGTSPMLASGKAARGAQKRRDQQAEQKGLQQGLEEENMENKTRDMQADETMAFWRNDGSNGNRDMLVMAATTGRIAKRDSSGAVVTETNANGETVPAMTDASRPQRRAALKQIISNNDAQAMQHVIDHFEQNADELTGDAEVELNRAMGSNELASSFGQKRPDWIQGNNDHTAMQGDAAFKKFGGPQLAAFHKSGTGELVKYLSHLRDTDSVKYRKTLSRYGAGLTEMISNPDTRAVASGNTEGMENLKNELSTLLEAEINSGRPIDDSMLEGLNVLENNITSDGSVVD